MTFILSSYHVRFRSNSYHYVYRAWRLFLWFDSLFAIGSLSKTQAMGNQFALGHLVHECIKGRRGKGEVPLQHALGEFQAQLYTALSLLPFTTSGHWLPSRRCESSKERGHGPSQAEGACHYQTSTWSRWCFSNAKCTLLSLSHLQWVHFFQQDPGACNVDVSIWPACLCSHNSQRKGVSSSLCTTVLILK